MSSMHEAYTICTPENIPVQIESITCYDNNVLLGTHQGHLLMYSVDQNVEEKKMNLQLLQYVKNFSKKPITQIDVIPEYQLLISLSDGFININDISRYNFPLVHSAVNKLKGATIFALDVKRTTSITGGTVLVLRLCAAIKKKLQLWYWKHDKFLDLYVEISLDDIPKALVWKESLICVGYKTDYVIFDISAKKYEKRDLFPSSSSRAIDPCIIIINDCFAVVKDEYLIAVPQKEADKQSTDDRKPLDAAKSQPKNQQFKSFAWTQPITLLVWDEPYAVGLNASGIEVRALEPSGPTNDTFVQSLPEVQKARYLARSKKGLLFAASVTQLWCIQNVDYLKQCNNLLKTKKFQLALQVAAILDETPEEKEKKKNEIQTLHSYDLFMRKDFTKSMEEFAKLETYPCDVIRLFPDLLPEDTMPSVKSSITKSSTPQLDGKDLELGLLALIAYLGEVRLNLLLKMQKEENKSSMRKSNNLLSIIDTTLIKCYLQTNDSMVASVIRRNNCHLEETEKTLRQYQKYSELILLYQTNGQHKKALQFLQSQADVHGSSLAGYERTIQYLLNLGNEHRQLIFEFSSWIIDKHPEDGLRVFTEDTIEVENLNRAEVLDFLLKNHQNLVTPYLEHVVHKWNEKKPIFHNILIQQYRKQIQEFQNEIKSNPNGSEMKQNEVARDNVKDKLIAFLNKSSYYTPETVLSNFPEDSLFEERAIILGKLKRHEKVLAIHIQILGNIQTAIEYCEKVYESDSNAAKTIFIQLIEILLHPPTTPPYTNVKLHSICLKPNLDAVLNILRDHATKIDPYAVLKILPDDISLLRLQPFLETALRLSLERRRNNEVLKGLLSASVLQLQEQRMHLESKSVTIFAHSVCPVCSKKFNQSALIRYSDGTIVHYNCREN